MSRHAGSSAACVPGVGACGICLRRGQAGESSCSEVTICPSAKEGMQSLSHLAQRASNASPCEESAKEAWRLRLQQVCTLRGLARAALAQSWRLVASTGSPRQRKGLAVCAAGVSQAPRLPSNCRLAASACLTPLSGRQTDLRCELRAREEQQQTLVLQLCQAPCSRASLSAQRDSVQSQELGSASTWLAHPKASRIWRSCLEVSQSRGCAGQVAARCGRDTEER